MIRPIFFSLLLLCVPGSAYAEQTSKPLNKDAENSWMVVNFWAQWCKPCRQEIPELNQLMLMLSNTNVKVLGINYDDIRGAELANAVASLDIRFAQLNAQQQATFDFSVPAALPATYIVAPNGDVKVSLIGLQTTGSILAALQHANPHFAVNDIAINEHVVKP